MTHKDHMQGLSSSEVPDSIRFVIVKFDTLSFVVLSRTIVEMGVMFLHKKQSLFPGNYLYSLFVRKFITINVLEHSVLSLYFFCFMRKDFEFFFPKFGIIIIIKEKTLLMFRYNQIAFTLCFLKFEKVFS